MTPAEALRRARATMECGGLPRRGCLFMRNRDGEAFEAHRRTTVESPLGSGPFRVHEAAASALLDGYSVAQITKAGG